MATNFEYAQLSGRVYAAEFTENRTPVPIGWEEIRPPVSTFYGFSGGAYFKASTNEIVISYTGTNEKADWIFANPQLTVGRALAFFFRQVSKCAFMPSMKAVNSGWA